MERMGNPKFFESLSAFFGDHFLDHSLSSIIFLQVFRPADTATQGECTFLAIWTRGRMRGVKRAILTFAVSYFFTSLVVAPIAEKIFRRTAKEGDRAAVHAFPVDALSAVAFSANV